MYNMFGILENFGLCSKIKNLKTCKNLVCSSEAQVRVVDGETVWALAEE